MLASTPREPDTQIRLITPGSPRLETRAPTGEPVVALGPGKPLALVAYLALSPRRTATRENLCDLLWGDWDLDQARQSVRQVLWYLRRKTHLILAEPAANSITLPPIEVDALSFSAAVERGELETAMNLYGGGFFEGFASRGTEEFERWASLERHRLRSLYVHTAEALARRLLDTGKSVEASRIARRLRTMDPHGETGWRLSLESLISAGDPIGARAEADQFQEWLRLEERDAEPASAALIRAARQPVAAKTPSTEPSDLRAELVGREREFSVLQSLWAEARVKGVRRIHIMAPGGLGKTRLVNDFCARLRSARANAVYLRAAPGEQHVPYAFAATIASALAALPGAAGISGASASALLALDPTLSSRFNGAGDPATGAEALRRRGLALTELAAAVADEAPLALVLDDLHWSDTDSAQLIATLSSRLRAEKLLLVSTARPHLAVPHHDDTVTLALHPLTGTHVEQLMESMAQLPDDAWATALPELIAESARGNPLLIHEALRLCLDHGALRRSDGRWSCDGLDAVMPTLGFGVLISRRIAELGSTERFVLLLLSLSGQPLPPQLVCSAAALSAADGSHAMRRLEAGGLVVLTSVAWGVAHDDIADAAVETAAEPDRRSAHHALGLAMSASPDSAWRRRAVEHLAATDDTAAVTRAAVAVVSRTHRTRESLDAELATLLGRHASPAGVEAVRATLPFWVRHSRWRRPAFAFAAGIALLLGGVAAWRLAPRQVPPAAELVIGVATGNGGFAVRRLAIDTTRWDATTPLALPPSRRAERWAAFPAREWRSVISPADGRWIREQVYADSGGVDVEVVAANGERSRLTNVRGDDRPVAFSPDGAAVLIMASRWNATGRSNLAVVDARTGVLRARLTRSTDATEGSAAWSPSGLRIAFVRIGLRDRHSSLCWVLPDGANETCHEMPGWTLIQLVGWTSADRVLVQADSAGSRKTFSVDPDSFEALPTDIPVASGVAIDPTGRWLLLPERRPNGDAVLRVAPVDRIDRARVIEQFPDSAAGQVAWWPVSIQRRYIDRVAIRRPRRAFVVGVPFVLRASGITRQGDTLGIEPSLMEWASANPARATVDADGVFIARDTGTVVIRASAGGWRSVEDTIRVEPRTSTLVADEGWTADFTARWRLFGDPLPVVVEGPKGRAFLNNGDGNFFSGAYLTNTVRSKQGLAVEAELTTPITRTQWQVSFVFLNPLSAFDSVAAWDHRTGFIPMTERQVVGCVFGYPQGEGVHSIESAGAIGPLRDVPMKPPLRLFDGAPYRVRIQLLPDGRCGVAIDGVALVASEPNAIFDDQWRVTLEGSSAGSPQLVHRVRIWQGVPDDIDWSVLRRQGHSWRLPRAGHK